VIIRIRSRVCLWVELIWCSSATIPGVFGLQWHCYGSHKLTMKAVVDKLELDMRSRPSIRSIFMWRRMLDRQSPEAIKHRQRSKHVDIGPKSDCQRDRLSHQQSPGTQDESCGTGTNTPVSSSVMVSSCRMADSHQPLQRRELDSLNSLPQTGHLLLDSCLCLLDPHFLPIRLLPDSALFQVQVQPYTSLCPTNFIP
jgi:hypothetical protein